MISLDDIKQALADHRVHVGVVTRSSFTDLRLGDLKPDQLAVALSPNPADLALQVDPAGNARVLNQTDKLVPFAVVVIVKNKIPTGASGIVIPPWPVVWRLLMSKLSVNLGALLGQK